MIDARITCDRFETGEELARLAAEGVGAIASFTGIVRGDGGLTTLTLEHYPAMTEAALRTLAERAAERWMLTGALIVHRVGTMTPGEPIVLVATSSPHRAAALESCAFLIEALKTDAPFWKRESFADGTSRWVEARDGDKAAAARWNA